MIIGATRVEQMKETIVAADVDVPDEVAEKLEELYPLPELSAP